MLLSQVAAEEALELARKWKCRAYFETSAVREDSGTRAPFGTLFTAVVGTIPNPPEPCRLLGARVEIGSLLARSKIFRSALYDGISAPADAFGLAPVDGPGPAAGRPPPRRIDALVREVLDAPPSGSLSAQAETTSMLLRADLGIGGALPLARRCVDACWSHSDYLTTT